MMDSLQISEDYVDNTEDVYQFASGKWNLKEYLKRIIVSVVNENSDKMEIEFDLVNVEAPIANALRRVLVAEVPTMAIEKIYLYQNTSCIQVS
jgi:DNA-directed RNA polymerase I and III subunit RPAC1